MTSSSVPDFKILASSLLAAFSKYQGVEIGTLALYMGMFSWPGFKEIFTGGTLRRSEGSKSSLKTSAKCLISFFFR